MIRVLHVVGRMDYGGAENRLLELARRIDPQDFYFDFCVLGSDPGAYADEIVELGFGIVPCKLGRNVLGFARRFGQVLQKGRYEVIHCHVHQFSGLPLRLAAKEGVERRIMHLRTTVDNHRLSLYRRFYRKLMGHWIRKYSTKIVAVSESAMSAYMGPDWQNDSRNQVVYNGLEVSPFLLEYDRAEVLAEFAIPCSAKVVVHVGNFGPAKDHRTLIRTAELLVREREDVHFLLVGAGALMSDIQQMVEQKKLGPRVHFAGHRPDVPRLLLSSDCFLFPSRWEGLPGAVLEALAAGLAVVASDIGPNREVAQVSERVKILPLGDAQALAGAVLEVISDPHWHRGPAGQIPETFSLDGFVEKMLDLYRC